MSTEVWKRVVSGTYRSAPGKLVGFARRRIEGASYPALVRDAKGTVEGVVYYDVDESDITRLDSFEGNAYERIQVTVEVAGNPVDASTYLFIDESRLSPSEWEAAGFDPERFLRDYRPGVG